MNNRADFLRSPRTRVDMHGDQLTKWHINGALSEVPGKVQLTFSQSTQSVHFYYIELIMGFSTQDSLLCLRILRFHVNQETLRLERR